MTESDVHREIDAIREAFAEAENRGDPSVILAHLDPDDYVRMPPGRPAMDAAEAAREIESVFDTTDITVDWRSDGVLGSSDLAVDSGTFTIELVEDDGDGPTRRTGDWLMVFRRGADGEWTLVRDIYNWNDDE